MIFEKYPYTEYHEINLDWILAEITRLKEELDKVGDIDEKIKELEDMLNNLYKLLADVIGKDLVDKSLFNLHGQVIADKLSRFNAMMTTQGMCIGEDGNGRPVMMNTFIDGNTNLNEVVFTYFDTGAEIGRVTGLNLGHGNSCCYNKTNNMFYVACGGGTPDNPYVMPIALDGTLGSVISIDGKSCWAITWNQDKFYCLTGSGTPYLSYLYVTDNNFQILEKYEYWQDEEFTYQGLCSDDNFLYLFNGNTIMGSDIEHNINRCSVLTKDGRDIKQVYMAYPLEIEEGDFYNGRLYISSNTTHAAIICESDMYVKNRHCAFGEPLDTTDFNKNVNDIHVDESYMDFLMDGSSDHPLSAITLIILWLRNSTDRIGLKIETDITQLNSLSFRRCPNTIFDIDGQNHKLPNLLFDGGTLYLNNAVLPGINNEMTIQFFGKRLVVNKITFGESGSIIVPSRMIFCTCNFEIADITLNQMADYVYYMTGSGFIRTWHVNTLASDGYYSAISANLFTDQTYPVDRIQVKNRYTMQQGYIYTYDQNKTWDFSAVKYPILIQHISSGTINNLPAGISQSDVQFIRFTRFGTSGMWVEIFKTDDTIVQFYKTV